MLSTSGRFNKQGEGGGAVHPFSANSMGGGGVLLRTTASEKK